MTHSKLTNKISLSSQSSSRDGTEIDRFLVHHAASTSQAGVVGMMVRGTRTVSANYVVGDTVTLVVDEDRRAWTSGASGDGGRGAAFDKRSITVETINDSTDDWTVSDKTFDNLARLIADVATRYEFPINDDTVLTHQELWTRFRASYPTACPGDLQRRKAELLKLAKSYQSGKATGGGTAAAKPTTTTDAQAAAPTPVLKEEVKDMNYIIRSKNRPHAAIIGGEFKRLANSEELKIVQKLTPIAILDKMNDREYDVLRAIATRGAGVTKSEVQAIVDKLAKSGVTITAELDLDAIADAVNDEAAARLKG